MSWTSKLNYSIVRLRVELERYGWVRGYGWFRVKNLNTYNCILTKNSQIYTFYSENAVFP